jgi:hypothetical protein
MTILVGTPEAGTGLMQMHAVEALGSCLWDVVAYAWLDENENGRRDRREDPLPGVTVAFYHDLSVSRRTERTDAGGLVRFSWELGGPCLVEGDVLVVTADTPAGHRPTTPTRVSTVGGAAFGFVAGEPAASPTPTPQGAGQGE